MFQKTIARSTSLEGVGIHSGKKVVCHFIPAQAEEGIRFINQQYKQEILVGKVVPQGCLFATVLSFGGWRLSTVEHLLAALYALGLDALTIVVEGDELPIADGSALTFVQLFQEVGMIELKAKKRFLSVKEPLFLGNQEQSILLSPYENVKRSGIDLSIELNRDPVLFGGAVKTCFTFNEPVFFLKEVVPARTFGRFEQREFLLENGFGLGASLDNTLVFKEGVWMQSRRFEDEALRHKVLDLMGDLMLLGAAFKGVIEVKNPSHSLHRLVIQEYVEHPEKWVLE